jgi:hypothetical protein
MGEPHVARRARWGLSTVACEAIVGSRPRTRIGPFAALARARFPNRYEEQPDGRRHVATS